MKKLLATLFVFAMGLGVFACTSAPIIEEVVLETDNQVFALQAVSASSLIELSTVQATALPVGLVVLEDTTETPIVEEPIVSTEIDEINRYLAMVEQFLGSDNGLTVTQAVSDLPEWEYMMTYTSVDLLGNPHTYILYYNEESYATDVVIDDTTTTTVTTEEPEVTTTDTETTITDPLSMDQDMMQDQDNEHNFCFEDDEDDSVKYLITGILVDGDLVYNVEGKQIVEDDEEVLRLRSYIDQDNYVKVEYKTENDGEESKFFFEVVQDGIVTSESKVKISNEDNELKVKLEIVEGLASASFEYKEETEDGVTYIKIRYELVTADGTEESGQIKLIATIDEVTGEVIYSYQVQDDGDQYMHEYQQHHGHYYGENNGNSNNDDDDDDTDDDTLDNSNL
ncbi:MAG: hypothetical protein KJ971_03715 [Firmicutes bacterium]|nr:hypothetical protein [Bacillota bacterium]